MPYNRKRFATASESQDYQKGRRAREMNYVHGGTAKP
jgi:hypothetical protein